MYDPKTGRYLEADPIGQGDGAHLYVYAAGDPANLVDPLGLGRVTNNSSRIIFVTRENTFEPIPVGPGQTEQAAEGFWKPFTGRGFEDSGPTDVYGKIGDTTDVEMTDGENGQLAWDYETPFDRIADRIEQALAPGLNRFPPRWYPIEWTIDRGYPTPPFLPDHGCLPGL